MWGSDKEGEEEEEQEEDDDGVKEGVTKKKFGFVTFLPPKCSEVLNLVGLYVFLFTSSPALVPFLSSLPVA